VATLAWLALALAVLAFFGSVAYAAVRGLDTWRAFRRFSDTAGAAAEALADAAARAEERAVSLTDRSGRLTAAIEHLQESLAELALIRAAAGEARTTIGRFTGLVPRK
jgi:hypothetical protein